MVIRNEDDARLKLRLVQDSDKAMFEKSIRAGPTLEDIAPHNLPPISASFKIEEVETEGGNCVHRSGSTDP